MSKYDKINGHDVADLTSKPHQMIPEANTIIERIGIVIDKDKFKTDDIDLLRSSIKEILDDEWDSVDIIRKKYTALRDKQIKNDFTKGVIRGLWLALSVLGEADFLEDNYEE
jgi:hypothetical protein